MPLKPVDMKVTSSSDLKKELISLLSRLPDREFDLQKYDCDFFYYVKSDASKERKDARFMSLRKSGSSSDTDIFLSCRSGSGDGDSIETVKSYYQEEDQHSFYVVRNKLNQYFEAQLENYAVHLKERIGDGFATSGILQKSMIDALGYYAGANEYSIEDARKTMLKHLPNGAITTDCFKRLEVAFGNGIVGDEREKVNKAKVQRKNGISM